MQPKGTDQSSPVELMKGLPLKGVGGPEQCRLCSPLKMGTGLLKDLPDFILHISNKHVSGQLIATADVAEWLRRLTRNQLGSPRAGSSPAVCGKPIFYFASISFRVIFRSRSLLCSAILLMPRDMMLLCEFNVSCRVTVHDFSNGQQICIEMPLHPPLRP